LHVHVGVTAIESGDTFAAVIHFTEALRLDHGTEHERLHRTRIGTALRHCPQLTRVATLDGDVLCADRERAVTIGANGAFEVRGLFGGQSTLSGRVQEAPPYEGALGCDGRFLGVVNGKGAARIWDVSRNEPHDLPSAGRGDMERLAFHPDGRVLLVKRTGGAMEAWDVTTWTQRPWGWLAKSKSFATLGEDSRWLLTCDVDEGGQVWDAGTGKKRGAALRFDRAVRAGTVGPGGQTVAAVGPDNELSVWDASTGRRLGRSIALPEAISRIAFDPNAERIATICSDRIVRVWQVRTGTLLAQTPALDDATASLTFSEDCRLLLTMGEVGGARVWDATTGHAATPPLRAGGRLEFAAFRAGGKEVVPVP